MYKVFTVDTNEGKRFQVFWCPSSPRHYNDKVPYIDPRNVKNQGLYTRRQAAYRRMVELNKSLESEKKQEQ